MLDLARLWRNHPALFPPLPERSRYNWRRRQLAESINHTLGQETMASLQRFSLLVRLVLACALAALSLAATMGAVPPGTPPLATAATTVPTDFQDTIALQGFDTPTAVRFAPDGRVFVTEKAGRIFVFESVDALQPSLVIDIRNLVNSYWDHGLSGLAIDPNFPATPAIYVTYTRDAPLGVAAPYWNDSNCGSQTNGCLTSGRLSRFHLNIVSGKVVSADPEVPLIDDWCQQFSSHTNDDVVFGPDGKLYVSAGEGASFVTPDYGQFGNPCGDPPFEGGSLRSQDFRTPGDPLGYNGTVLRVDPQDPSTPQVIAYGLRNPYRLAFNPRSAGELWAADAGSTNTEELNRIPDVTTEQPLNFGWPCYEGAAPAPGFVGLRSILPLCDLLYDPSGQGAAPPAGQTPGATLPYFRYNHDQRGLASDGCLLTAERRNPVSSAVTGIAFYRGGAYPEPYHSALFFTDYARQCIWAMGADDSGMPDPSQVIPFVVGDVAPVDLQIGPNGDLYYVDIAHGTIHRVTYQTPVAVIASSATNGAAPLAVTFDGTGSTPAGAITYNWDFDGDGTWDSTDPQPTHTYPVGEYTARLRVVKPIDGTSNTTSVRISADNTPPSATIAAPGPSLQWRVGQVIHFSGVGSDAQDGVLPASAYTWAVVLHHGTHEHPLQTFTGVTSGSFVAPDHEYPAWLELRLTVRDRGNLTAEANVEMYPQTVTLSFTSSPAGATIAHNFAEQPAPFSSTVILGSHNTVSTTAPDGMVLTGWAVNDQAAGWAPGLSLLADGDKSIAATFGTVPRYDDVAANHPAYRAVSELGARGLLKGYGDGRFGPEDKLLRAQIAVLLVRALGWGGEQHPNPFTDGGGIAAELWDAVATLAARNIARGYDADTYGPNDQVLQAQAISLITRTMVAQGYWEYQPDDPSLYTAVPASAGHRVDLATFVHYAGALPDVPADQPFATWNQPATRGWFARAFWQALDSYWGTDGTLADGRPASGYVP